METELELEEQERCHRRGPVLHETSAHVFIKLRLELEDEQ